MWFCEDADHRFDLPDEEAGTCYTATTEVGCFIEVFLRIAGKGLDESEIRARKLATLSVTSEQQIVDLLSRANYGLRNSSPEILNEIDPPYPRSQPFAARIYTERLNGISWSSTRDPQNSINIAIFAQPGGADTAKIFDISDERDVPQGLMYQVAEEFHVPLKRSAREYPVP
ncbi:RES family NAD+ phosphorylase [Streptomyces sp. NPDC004787]|uniref:RES family NAD+ phosphorylase n=1 Tax=Streptomyces sp. NPDC004787 TaxID=3154291 RepID=UPI0033AAB059